MTKLAFKNFSFYFIGTITILIWSILLWDYFHGGVPSHHFLARKDMPKISNWWGGLTLPILSYLTFFIIQKRVEFSSNEIIEKKYFNQLIISFLIAFIYAVSLATAFTLGVPEVSSWLFQILFVIAFIFPVYKSEYYLGFVIGLSYAFGGVLPIIIGLLFVIISFISNKLFHPIIKKIGKIIGIVK